MSTLLAQISPEELEALCGPSEAFWMCELVYGVTGNEWLGRVAGGLNMLLHVLLILVLAYIAMRLSRSAVRRFARRMERQIDERLERNVKRGVISRADNYRDRRLRRLQAVTGVAQGVVSALVWLIAVLAIVQALGVSLQPVLAGAGLLGIVIGFGAQQLVRDVLAGIAMLIEDQYGVGDWIEVDQKMGQVERVGLRATSYRDLDGALWHVLNGHIQHVANLSQEWSRMTYDIPLALDTDIPMARSVISRVATELGNDPVWSQDIIGPHEIWGVQEFGPEGLAIRCVFPTRPFANWDIKRQMRERLSQAFAEAGIRQPGQLVDLGGRPDAQHAVPWEQRRQFAHRDPGAGRPTGREAIPRPGAQPSAGAGHAPETDPDTPDDLDHSTELPLEVRDETTELRIRRGSQPRPD